MGRIAYYIKDVRENTNTHGITTADVLDTTYVGNRNFAGSDTYKFYEWPSDLTDEEATATVHGTLAYAALTKDLNILTSIDRSADYTRQDVVDELLQVYDQTTVEDTTSGNEIRLRAGKRIYIFGYAYSASGAVPNDATITWKE